jgi:uncharacterized protein (TIGR03437 family)
MLDASALAAAGVTRVHNGQTTNEQVYQVVNGDQVYLVYGSGLGSATSATATIGNVSATVASLYAGPQSTCAGPDRHNILIPASLAGADSVNIVVTAGSKPSTAVNVTIQ